MTDIPIFDTHQHLLLTDRWPYTWAKNLSVLDGGCFDEATYREHTESTGIVGALFMESTPDYPHWRQEAHDMLAASADDSSIIRGVIAQCRPEEDRGFESWVEELVGSENGSGLKGLRRILHVPGSDELAASRVFTQNVARLSEWGLTFDVCVRAEQVQVAIDLADTCPDTQLILDHCGLQILPRPGSSLDTVWRTGISELARRNNVVCKISGIPAHCAPGSVNAASLRPIFEHCVGCFGWDRVVWGGDWPVCLRGTKLKDWVEVSRELAQYGTAVEQQQLFFRNAERVYNVNTGVVA